MNQKMIKKIYFTIALFSCLSSFSQEIISSTPIDLKKNVEVFAFVNEPTGQTNLFFLNENEIKAFRLDDEMKFIDSLSTPSPEKGFSKMLGNTTSGNLINLFWSSNNQKKIILQQYDFDKQKISNKNFTLEFKNEIYLQEFSSENTFFILTLVKKSNAFKLYVFDNNGSLEVKDIDLSSTRFYHRADLYETFLESFMPFETPFSLEKINSKTPVSLVESAKKRKCYIENNQLIITIDTNQNYTQLIEIDLVTYKATSKTILQTPFKNFNTTNVKFNSFYLDSKIYQVKSSPNKFYMTIKDLNGNLLKEYMANEEIAIDFKNSEINQQGNNFGGTGQKTLEHSSQFIRKVNNSNLGISCYAIKGNYMITLGSVSEQNSGGEAAMYGGMFGAVGVLLAYAISNPTLESFNSYSGRKSITIAGLFDKNDNHIQGEINPLAFDKISIFFDENKKIKAQTLFRTDAYYLGYYDIYNKTYNLRKFED